VPVLKARLTLNLPSGWEHSEQWIAHTKIQPTADQAVHVVWDAQNIPRLRKEWNMPSARMLEGRMLLHFFGPGMQDRSARTWETFGAWYDRLASGRRTPSPQITAKAKEVTATAPDFESKVRNIAQWMQHEIRYVSIQIGIGGRQPHPATDIFAHRYGDCKDKATLMSSLLHEAGIESEYVIANLDDRSAVVVDAPSGNYFNHVILAIKLPGNEFKDAPAAFKDRGGQRWLLFDPTDEHLNVGYIEGSMQGSYGLLVHDGHGELIRMPLVDPQQNYTKMLGKLKLASDGGLSGELTLAMSGDAAEEFRRLMKKYPANQLRRVLERYFNEEFAGGSVEDIAIENADHFDQELRVRCKLSAASYAKNAGPLLLVRPRVFGTYRVGLDQKERQFPYEFDYVESMKDDIEIELPAGYKPDELPRPVKYSNDFADYSAKAEMVGNTLHYTRTMDIRNPEVPVDKILDLRRLLGTIAMDEKASAIFKKAD
jgi:Transglutaminase-like superfamily